MSDYPYARNQIGDRLQGTIERAQDAFFRIIVNEYDLKTGDLDPHSTLEFYNACLRVAEQLRHQNEVYGQDIE